MHSRPTSLVVAKEARKGNGILLCSELPSGCEGGAWKRGVSLAQASELLRRMCTRNLVRKYCRGISAERRALVGTGLRVGAGGRGAGAAPQPDC